MKYLKTFENFQINEGLLDSAVFKKLQNEKDVDKSGKTFREKLLGKDGKDGLIRNDPEIGIKSLPKSYIDFDLRNSDKNIDGKVDLSDVTLNDYEAAIKMGDENRWANPSGPMLGGPPKFFKAADEKIQKAYKYIYQLIDSKIKGGHQYTPGSG